MAEWKEHIPKGIGLLCLNDGFVGDKACGHGITTKNYLSVIYNQQQFPAHFEHLFLDTLTSDRSKEIGEYVFCENANVNHQHHLVGNIERDQVNEQTTIRARTGIGDKKRKDNMDQLWIKGERENAIRRKKEALANE